MTRESGYVHQNPSGDYASDGFSENPFNYFYPTLNKHNNNFYVANTNQRRNGNLNATFMMRMTEVCLIEAEADINVNGESDATQYINKSTCPGWRITFKRRSYVAYGVG
ncbi:RagB/SusD family nutrient uptake outer membrane protein [Proteiniphilum sp. UBA1028]|uniref:RagB/SusD family nutrient uptake outer membrane protein n=1 Tax=Proteiniphilum sp. UBA1028 TaxID=1947251 RepID=UPI00268F2E08